MSKKVALGLSGGVDSAVAALKLVRAGYQVTAVFMECFREEGCRTDQDRKDALAVALQLGLPFISLDFKQAYQERVLEYFYNEYAAGRTPNPDVLCNREIKFGLFLQWAEEQGFDYVATGHYAKTANKKEFIDCSLFSNIEQNYFLCAATDEWKDQTYFLNQIPVHILPKILFPLGQMEKSQVRAMAAENSLVVADKKDSTGVCFVGEINVRDFLREKLGNKKGVILNMEGEVVGEHEGAWFYTIGQRHGLNIKVQSADAEPLFVVQKNMERNEVIVGKVGETEKKELLVREMNWLIAGSDDFCWEKLDVLAGKKELRVRIRHTGELMVVKKIGREGKVELDKKVKGVSEGQFAVFYAEVKRLNGEEEKVCLGGGVLG